MATTFAQAGQTIVITGNIVAIERLEQVNIHRPTKGVDPERIGTVTLDGTLYRGVIEYVRMVVVQNESGELVQWFGKSSTKFWQENFSTKLDTPKTVGDCITVQGTVKLVKPADEHFGERAVIQRPKAI